MAKKLTNLERELFDAHRKQKAKFQMWKNQEGPAIEVNQEFVALEDETAKLKRFKAT